MTDKKISVYPQYHFADVFRKSGLKPVQTFTIDTNSKEYKERTEAVKQFLKEIDDAKTAPRHSTLRFGRRFIHTR